MSKRDEIIDAAVKEFAEYSYDAASINRIIKSSGTSKGTFYHYFRGKKDLYFTIVKRAMDIKQSYMSNMLSDVKREGSDFFEIMKKQTEAAAAFMKDNPDLFKFGTRLAMEPGTVQNEVFEKFVPDVTDSFMKVVEKGIEGRNFTKRYPPGFMARVILYMTMNYYDILFEKGDEPSYEDIQKGLDMMFDFIKRGFS